MKTSPVNPIRRLHLFSMFTFAPDLYEWFEEISVPVRHHILALFACK
jgi:hypothetical protein